MEPENKGCRQGTDAENKGCFGKARPYQHKVPKGCARYLVGYQYCATEWWSDTEQRKYNTVGSQVVLVASMAFCFLAQMPGSTDW